MSLTGYILYPEMGTSPTRVGLALRAAYPIASPSLDKHSLALAAFSAFAFEASLTPVVCNILFLVFINCFRVE